MYFAEIGFHDKWLTFLYFKTFWQKKYVNNRSLKLETCSITCSLSAIEVQNDIKWTTWVSSFHNSIFSNMNVCYNYNFAKGKRQVKPLFSERHMHHSTHLDFLCVAPSSLVEFPPLYLCFYFTNTLSYFFLPSNCLRQQKVHRRSQLCEKKRPHALYHHVCTNPLQAQAPLLLAQMTMALTLQPSQSPFCSTRPKWCEDRRGVRLPGRSTEAYNSEYLQSHTCVELPSCLCSGRSRCWLMASVLIPIRLPGCWPSNLIVI